MATRPSRTYKLKLSDKGIALYLECHGRLCQLAGDLLPYGMTLRVCVTLLERMPPGELAAELASANLAAFAGPQIRFVGTSPTLATLTAELSARVAAIGPARAAPQTWRLFLAALALLRVAKDPDVLSVYQALRDGDHGAGRRGRWRGARGKSA